jgi:hypothetical protein
MHRHALELLNAETRARLAGRPESDLLKVPIDAVEALPPEIRTLLRDTHDARTLGDLRRVDLRAIQPKISAHLVELVTCLLHYPQHDAGPDCDWERLFQAAPTAYYASYPGTPFHTRFGPVFYRGRLDGSAQVLVVGQDPASDETLAGRAFVGTAGQIAQTFLHKLGITRSYLMLNTFLFGVQSGSITDAMVADATIQGYRNQLLDRAMITNSISLILAFGAKAQDSVQNWPGKGSTTVLALTHPTAPNGVAANWNSHLGTAIASVTPDWDGTVDATPFPTPAAPPRTDIPRRDLPFGLPSWHGTGGTRSQRVSGAFETQITWTAP